MTYRTFLLLLLACTFFSCKNEKAELLTQFTQLYEHTALKDFPVELDKQSLEFYTRITDKNNLNIDSIVRIGIEFQVPYFAMLYLASCGEHMIESGEPSDFFYHLSSKNISFFSSTELYETQKEKTRIQNDGWVAIYRKESGRNYLSWVKYVPEAGGYKYDLLYTLQTHEKTNRSTYDEFREDYPDATEEEYFKALYKAYNIQNCEIEKIKKRMSGGAG